MQRLYVAGPMSGLPDLNFPAFHAAAAELRAAGFEVRNPAEINVAKAGEWLACMRDDVKALMDCDGIALLPGWENSRGARVEHTLAVGLGLPSKPLAEWLPRRNGCHNRDPLLKQVSVQDGWTARYRPAGEGVVKRVPSERAIVQVPFRMSERCEYTATSELGQVDPGCIGCRHRAPALDAMGS